MMKTVALPSGKRVPALGIGTWKMGENSRLRSREIAALRRAIDLGMTVIDTAEMYGEGAAEELIGEAIMGRRQEVFLVSKVYPHNATRRGTADACERSLRRLGIDSIDLYLLHWRGSVPLSETLDALAALQASGKIGSYGVSNFDTSDMEEAWALDQGRRIAVNQILYNLTRRGPEIDLLPWLRSRGAPVMAYSPIEQGRLLRNPKLAALAQQRGATPAQIALAWLLAQQDVLVIPKAGELGHVDENRAAADIVLTREDLSALDIAFPRPLKRKPLEML
ncbi:MAG TPA: aldo/keto reductase [Bryobacteraceae bacterium]|jgi:diketogulonate reductase-like aldo/keto reductase|nr:aldo/keto reductase [Bryobacteraceae bacterium]